MAALSDDIEARAALRAYLIAGARRADPEAIEALVSGFPQIVPHRVAVNFRDLQIIAAARWLKDVLADDYSLRRAAAIITNVGCVIERRRAFCGSDAALILAKSDREEIASRLRPAVLWAGPWLGERMVRRIVTDGTRTPGRAVPHASGNVAAITMVETTT